MFGKSNKFLANDQFGEKIILLNKEKICLFANAKFDEFLEKIVVLNVLSLWLYKKVILYAIGITFYNNCHFFIAKLLDIFFLLKYIADDFIFEEKFSHTGMQNNTIMSAFLNFFYTKTAHLSIGISLSRYINFARGNWNNYNQNNDFMSNIATNDGLKSEIKDFN